MSDSPRRLGWLQFDLRTILLVALVVCTTTAWLLERNRRRRDMQRHQQVQQELQLRLDQVEVRLQELSAASAAVNRQWQLRQLYQLKGHSREPSAESTATFVFSFPVGLHNLYSGFRHAQLQAARDIAVLREQLSEESLTMNQEQHEVAAPSR